MWVHQVSKGQRTRGKIIAAARKNVDDAVVGQLERWARDLIDLTQRNHALYYRPTKRTTLRVLAPDPVQFHLQLTAGTTLPFYLPPLIDESEEAWTNEDFLADAKPNEIVTDRSGPEDLTKTLTQMMRTSQQDWLDRAVRTLYVSFGILEWSEDPAGRERVTSPLLYLPVTVARKSPRDPFFLQRSEDDPVLNPSLIVKLQQDFGIDLLTLSDDLDDVATLDELLEHVEDAVDARGWSVKPEAILKRSTFHKESMYRDLLNNREAISQHRLVRSLAGEISAIDNDVFADLAPEQDIDIAAPPEQAHLVLDADASQRRAIHAAAKGGSFVMDGPPGTGKSQTITNMIAELIALGRTVLFVSEKAAALEVVAKRLAAIGLDEFVLELHSHKANRKEVVQQLERSLRTRAVARDGLSDAELNRARTRREELTDYAEAVNETRDPLGRSVGYVAGRVAELNDVPELPLCSDAGLAELEAGQLTQLEDEFARLGRSWHTVVTEGFAWAGYAGDPLRGGNREVIIRLLETLREDVKAATEHATRVSDLLGLNAPANIHQLEQLSVLIEHLMNRPTIHMPWLEMHDVQSVRDQVMSLQDLLEVRRARSASIEADFTEAWRQLDWPELEVTDEAVLALRRSAHKVAGTTRLTRKQLIDACAQLERLEAALRELISLARDVGTAVRFRRGLPELDALQRMLEVLERVDGTVRPPADLLAAGRGRAALQAIERVRPKQERYELLAAAVSDVFAQSVYGLDLSTIRLRLKPNSITDRLRGPYRTAKAELAAASRAGRFTPELAGKHLDDAVEAQHAERDLRRALQQWRSELAPFRNEVEDGEGFDIDWEAALAAARLAAEVDEHLGGRCDLSALQAQFSEPTPSDRDLRRNAQRLSAQIDEVLRLTKTLDELAPAGAAQRTPAILLDWTATAGVAYGTMATLLEGLESSSPRTWQLDDLRKFVTQARTVLATEATIDAQLVQNAALLGKDFSQPGTEIDLDGLIRGLNWAERTRELFKGPLSTSQAAIVTESASDLGDGRGLHERIDSIQERMTQLMQLFDPEDAQSVSTPASIGIASIIERADSLIEQIDSIDAWCDARDTRRSLGQAGFVAALAEAERSRIGPDQLPQALERSLLTGWLELTISRDKRLRSIRPGELDAKVREFRNLDERLLSDAALRVVVACSARRPRGTLGGVGIIRREASKKSRHKPVRQLLAETQDVAMSIKPCFMMSPLSVSQFIPSDWRFDVVIFDEASQVPPADAINCVYRGNQLIIAGDDKQLPPTSFFMQSMDDDEYDEEDYADFESVLGLCKASNVLAALPLRWHYRSRHEDLIAFSNHQFYEGDLVTYPGAEVTGPTLGVELYRVNGIYRRGTRRDNVEEARFVAQRVIHHAQEHPDLSIGVVALSSAQAEAIEDAVDQLRREHPKLERRFAADRLDGFFVKNLENVQGDDRDLIIISLGYGPDEAGKFTMNFGPINRSGGWRRLNVAVTRARRRVEVVSSFGSDDMKLTGGSGDGLRHLHAYLRYAELGPISLAIGTQESKGDVESPLELSVLRTISSWGYEVVPQVGTAGYRVDLGVRDPSNLNRFLMGVECDGRAYHSSRVARDRDRLRQQVLEGLGWQLHRVWGPTWYRNRRQAEQDLRDALEQAARGARVPERTRSGEPLAQRLATPQVDLVGDGATHGPRGMTSRPPRSTVLLEEVEVVDTGPPTWAVPYIAASLEARKSGRASDPQSAATVLRMVEEVVKVETPVHRDVVARRVADAFGHSLTQTTRTVVYESLAQLKKQKRLTVVNHVARIGTGVVVRIPGESDETRRDIEHIPLDELTLALRLLLEEARSASEDELITATRELLGFSRTGAKIAKSLAAAVASLLRAGTIVRTTNGSLRIAEGIASASISSNPE
jgi:very-short-patch-repair endonuclease